MMMFIRLEIVTQSELNKITVSAAIKFNPKPPARVLIKKINVSGSLLKEAI